MNELEILMRAEAKKKAAEESAKEEIQKTVGSIPVYMIGMKDYGMMNGDSVLAQALEYLGK